MAAANPVKTNVDTNHWDTVYVADFDVVNKAIKSQASFPSSFNFTDPATKVVVSGAWSSWELALGGAGPLVHMSCTVKSGTATSAGTSGNLTGGTLIIQFSLEQVKVASERVQDRTAKAGTGTTIAHQFPRTAASSGNTVSVMTTNFPNMQDPLLADALQTIFTNYFNAHLADIKATFHVMNLNEKADVGDFQWLKPSAASYAVAQPTTNATIYNSAFGVLSMVDKTPIGIVQTQAVDVASLVDLPAGANSAFVISAKKVTKHMLLKGAICTIQGSKETDFDLSDSGLNITNTKELLWGNFKSKKVSSRP